MESPESKFDTIFNAINALSARLMEVEGVVHNTSSVGAASARVYQVHASMPEEIVPPVIQQETTHNQQRKEPRVSLPEKFDGTRSKFRGFINQVRLVTMLQPQRYPTEESRVGFVGTLFTGQALSWFAPLFENRSPILSNFEAFLQAFAEAFAEHDKARVAASKIYSLRQGSRPASVYASDFRQLAADINWGEEALMCQFHRGLKDNVKDLLLNLSDPRTLDEAISQAVKCDNRLFKRYQDQRLSNYSRQRLPTPVLKVTKIYQNIEDKQIDSAYFKPLTLEEKQRRFEEKLCLYCGEPGHRVDGCSKKRKTHTTRIRSTTIQENKNG